MQTKFPQLLRIFLLLSLFIPLKTGVVANPIPRSGMELVKSDERGVLVRFYAPTYQILTEQIAGKSYQRIQTPERTELTLAGKPSVPVISGLIAVPAKAKVDLKILDDNAETLPGSFLLIPASKPVALHDDLDAPALAPGSYPPVNVLFPEDFVRITSDNWLRDQRVVRIEFFPFQFNSALGTLLWHKFVEVELRFTLPVDQPLLDQRHAAQPSVEAVLREDLLNYETSTGWRGLPDSLSETPFQSALFAQDFQPKLRIPVYEDGIYRISFEALRSTGFGADDLDVNSLSMSNQGRPVAILVEDGGDGKLDPGDSLLFYGEHLSGEYLAQQYAGEAAQWVDYAAQNSAGAEITWSPEFNATMVEKYTDENVYWLSKDYQAASRVKVIEEAPLGTDFQTTTRATVRAEEQNVWWSYHFTGEDTWFWEVVAGFWVTRSYTTSLPSVATGPYTATVRGEVVAFNQNPNATPDHDTRFYLNDLKHLKPIVQDTWDGRSRYQFEAEIDQADLIEGVNRLDFVAKSTPNLGYQKLYFDWFEVEYARALVAENNHLVFVGRPEDGQDYRLDGFTAADVRVWDVSNPLLPEQISYSKDAERIAFHSPGRRFLAASPQDVPIENIRSYQPPDFRQEAQYLFITHADLLTATQVLADYRSSTGLSTLVVDVADLYNTFNYGIYHPIAIKNFLKYTFSQWSTPPVYVLLVGDGHLNFHGTNNPDYTQAPIYMPPNLAWVDYWQGEVDSANLLATVVGEDPLADVFIARLPVNNAVELQAMTEKIIAYEAAPSEAWQQRSLFLADNPDQAGNFPALSEGIIQSSFPSFFQADRMYLDTTAQSSTTSSSLPGLVDYINNQGSLFVNYIGHASVTAWASEQILTVADIPLLRNKSRLPVVLSMDCLDGFWIHPRKELTTSLTEALIRSNEGGAIAAFAPTGLGVATGHDQLNRGFFDSLFKSGNWRIGSAAQSAKLKLYATGSDFDLLQTFTVFGDPALHIASPFRVSLDPSLISGSGMPGGTVNYVLTLTNAGAFTDTYSITTSESAWSAAYPVNVGPLPPGGVAEINVQVDIPFQAPAGSSQSLIIQAVSQGDIDQTAAVSLLTTVGLTGTPSTPTVTPSPSGGLQVFLPHIRR